MILIDKIDMACKQGRPVELRNGRKAYVVGNAENFFHQLDCNKGPLCKYIGYSTSDAFPETVAIMSWDDLGKYLGKLMHDPYDIVGLWDESDEDTPDVAQAVRADNDSGITEIHKEFSKYDSGLGASIDKTCR